MKWNTFCILFLASIIVSACGGGGPADAVERAHEYVGVIPGTELYVAIAVNPDGNVLAYVCDGMGIDYLFRGTGQPGDPLLLGAESSDARLEAVIEDNTYAGVFFTDGKEYPFVTVPAKDYGGLYHVTGLSETEAEGLSQSGSSLKASLLPDKSGLHLEVTTVDGVLLSSDRLWIDGHDHSEPSEYRENWVILLNNGSGRGGRIKSSFQAGNSTLRFFDPICPP
jgi:hypothetical protein